MEGLAEAAAGEWLVLTGCRKGPLRRALSTGSGGEGGPITPGGVAAARRELDRLVVLFGKENVAVEITDHGLPLDGERNDALAGLAVEMGANLVATSNAHYATPRDADLAGALAAIRARSSLDDMDGWLSGAPTAHLRSPEEMLRLHWRHPQAVETAHRLGMECAFDLRLVAPRLPPYPVPPGHNEASWLRALVDKGARERYGPRDAERVPGAYLQIEHELAVIEQLNFPGYFLIVHDLTQFCREHGILCQGRGSAANSAVCYALGVTAVDAVTHRLLFERFLAPERDEPPDIDVDIESDRREEVIQYVYERFGRINAAMVANVISYRPRSAVRDAARALGYDVGQQDAWSKSIDRWSSLKDRHKDHNEWLSLGRDSAGPRSFTSPPPPPPAAELDHIPVAVIDLAERLLRLPRHLGVHPGGMILCDRPIIDVCPVEWARMPGRTVLQWDKDDCADAGLVKFDLLGLGMLSALQYAFGFVRETEGIEITLHGLPQEDPRVYDLLCAADTVGVFQVESRAQMATLPRLQPRRFYDIVVEVALIRPGPIQGGSVHPYINRVRGREEVTYLHPLLERALSKTLGVPLFQEQLMQIVMDIAGFDASEADRLRRAMGSKRSLERMEALRGRLMEGMAEKGVGQEVAEKIFEQLKAFVGFGFPESHSFSFAYLVYASAWLKVHHPAAFYAGLLAAQPMGFYSPQSLVADARRHGVTVLRPSLSHSGVLARVERLSADRLDASVASSADRREDQAALVDAHPTLAVRMGLAAVRGIGVDVAEVIVAAREVQPFGDLRDAARRIRVRGRGPAGELGFAPDRGLSVAQWEGLATAGALDALGVTRREGLWASGALALEGPDTLEEVAVGIEAPTLPGMSDVELAVADVWASGVSTDSYPTAFVRDRLEADGVLRVSDVFTHEPGRRVRAAGVVTHRQRPPTASGVTFLSLEDETGVLNVICARGIWRRYQAVARAASALIVRGMIERADGATNLIADHIAPLSLRVPARSRDFR
jgi:error-prone DNA polymerase